MKIGLFDHIERSGDRALARQFDERLEFVQEADDAGFYCLHVAEHHGSPLNMAPAPSLWLAAVARAPRSAYGSGRWSICCRSIRRCAWPRKSACSTI